MLNRRKQLTYASYAGLSLLILLFAAAWLGAETDDNSQRNGTLQARILATGIPGTGAVAEVGDFLRGSPTHDKPAFTAFCTTGARPRPQARSRGVDFEFRRTPRASK